MHLAPPPRRPIASIALVGKGITFDTGGISLRRSSSLVASMQGDRNAAAFRTKGDRASAVFANDDDLLRHLLGAAGNAFETRWHLPKWEDLRDDLDPDVGDLDELGRGDEAGATMGARFLRRSRAVVPGAR